MLGKRKPNRNCCPLSIAHRRVPSDLTPKSELRTLRAGTKRHIHNASHKARLLVLYFEVESLLNHRHASSLKEQEVLVKLYGSTWKAMSCVRAREVASSGTAEQTR